VRSRFDAVPEAAVRQLVRDGWGVDALEWGEVLEGGGAHHWSAVDADGHRWFVTCDDLATKPWLGEDHDTVFAHLLIAYGTAIDLRDGGLDAVVAPIRSRSHQPAARLDDRHSIAVFEHVDGMPGRWGRPASPDDARQVVALLAALHHLPVTTPTLATRDLDVAGRAAFDAALEAVDQRWDGGPLSEPARQLLGRHLDVITTWLADLDRLAAETALAPAVRVVTHGEPHPGNLIWTASGLRLLDWDTVAVARPERDMWMIASVDATAAEHYRSLTGTTLDEELLVAFRRLWAVTDVAAFAAQLRAPHGGNIDDERALRAVADLLAGGEPDPYGPGGANDRSRPVNR
jgi:spectinomycin phosphotransferase